MLRVKNIPGNTPRLIMNVSNEDASSQKSDVHQNLLGDAVANSINPIFDNEVAEFKPESSEINFFMFFSTFNNIETLNQIKPYLEESFEFHLGDTLSGLTKEAKRTITNPKTFLQSLGIPVPKPHFLFHRSRLRAMEDIPYVILDPVEMLTSTSPSQEGLPVFYNSFALPFAKNLGKWGDEKLGFSNKTFLYNSFLLMDFYSTDNPLTQKKIMSVPVYVNGRYMGYTKDTKNVNQIRPAVYLNNATEGFSIVWLKKYKLDKLYVKFSFWDALNGEQITLVPSTEASGDKKWVQNPTQFDNRNLYLEYKFNYTTKTYSISEFNTKTQQYDIKAHSFDMYQLVYDEYFSKMNRIQNVRPTREDGIEAAVVGDEIALTTSNTGLFKTITLDLNDNLPGYAHIDRLFNEGNGSKILNRALYSMFQESRVKLKDRVLIFFEKKFQEASGYNEDLGGLVITNNSGMDLLIKKVEVKNIRVSNKNNFIVGQPLSVNKFSRSSVTDARSEYQCDTLFTFKGSNFFKKLTPIRQPFNNIQTLMYNHQSELYDNYYFDEANNKVVERPQENLTDILKLIPVPRMFTFFHQIIMKGRGTVSYTKNGKNYQSTVRGLTMGEKDLNLMLRDDILQKGGTTMRYDQMFPATNEKLVYKTEEYRDFGVTIKTTLSPQYGEFQQGLSLGLNSDVIVGRDFMKLFISTNDEITISYDVAISLTDKAGKNYKKLIPCSLKYL